MTIELATPTEHEAMPNVALELGSALMLAITEATKVLEARIISLELVTQAQHEKLNEFQDRFEKFEEFIDNELKERIATAVEEAVEEALDGLEVNCEISTGNRRWR